MPLITLPDLLIRLPWADKDEILIWRCVFFDTALLMWIHMTCLQTAVAFWTVLVVPQYPLMAEVIEFINVSSTITFPAEND